jgi:hypothetical protein
LSASSIAPEKIAAYRATHYRVHAAGNAFLFCLHLGFDLTEKI